MRSFFHMRQRLSTLDNFARRFPTERSGRQPSIDCMIRRTPLPSPTSLPGFSRWDAPAFSIASYKRVTFRGHRHVQIAREDQTADDGDIGHGEDITGNERLSSQMPLAWRSRRYSARSARPPAAHARQLLGAAMPTEYGGKGGDAVDYLIVVESLFRHAAVAAARTRLVHQHPVPSRKAFGRPTRRRCRRPRSPLRTDYG